MNVDLEIATNYFEKTVMEKGDKPRHFNMSGTNRAIFDVLSRSIKYGKKIEFVDSEINLEVIKSRVDENYDLLAQYVKTGGKASFNRDFSYGNYDFKFVD